jgi:hypothetical protein
MMAFLWHPSRITLISFQLCDTNITADPIINKYSPISILLICGINSAEPIKYMVLPVKDNKKLTLKDGNLQHPFEVLQTATGS